MDNLTSRGEKIIHSEGHNANFCSQDNLHALKELCIWYYYRHDHTDKAKDAVYTTKYTVAIWRLKSLKKTAF